MGKSSKSELINASNVCLRCSIRNDSICCSCQPGMEELMLPFSENEKNRILSDDGGVEEFISTSPNTPAFTDQIKKLFNHNVDVVDKVFLQSESHYRFKLNEKNKCSFLQEKGCALKRENRPWMCKLYPFWFADSQIHFIGDEKCLALLETRTYSDLIKIMETDISSLQEIYYNLCKDWGLPPIKFE